MELVKQGHSEQFAHNEQPGSADYYHGDNSVLFNKGNMPTSKRPKLDIDINQVLATEILRKILQKLDIKNLCMAREICKHWKAIIDGFQLVEEAAGEILDFALMIKLN